MRKWRSIQSGDVDYLVATDAIGMGLNMDVDHVAFAATRKFDGFHYRNLNPAELGQIAGRAGRYLNDGTFGVDRRGRALRCRNWSSGSRTTNSILCTCCNGAIAISISLRSIDLRASLEHFPRIEGLTRAQAGPDVMALETLARDANDPRARDITRAVARLWEVCQIPDYRNISANEHASLVGRIFEFLRSGNGRIPEDWFSRQLTHCDHSDGDIDTLSNRICACPHLDLRRQSRRLARSAALLAVSARAKSRTNYRTPCMKG